MEKKENILVFDSGIGGVTVLKEIIKILPNENYIYYSDSKNNPYGDKTNKEIIKICDGSICCFSTRYLTFAATVVVFPAPAPATTSP